MSKSKIIGLTALMTFAFAIVGLSNAVAGEKVEGRIFKYLEKYEQIEVGDEKGHVVGVYEVVGIVDNKKPGESFLEGWAYHESGLLDMNIETGVGSGNGYFQYIDKDGDKIVGTWEGKMVEGVWKRGQFAWVKGTGKFEGIKATGNWFDNTVVAPNHSYVDFEGEMELP